MYESSNTLEAAPKQLLRWLRTRSRVVVITGAGCSTDSGIPCYRDHDGKWQHSQPMQHKSFVESPAARRRYWARSLLGWPRVANARPNPAHHALFRLEQQSRLCGIITQNVDRLHQASGSQKVIDLHGRLDQVVCLSCQKLVSRQQMQQWLQQSNPTIDARTLASLNDTGSARPDGDVELLPDHDQFVVPNCPACGGTLMPDVVFYGGTVPATRVQKARTWVAQADAMLIVGSSLMVYSALRFVRQAHELGLPIIALNQGKTRADDLLTAKIQAPCVEALNSAVSALEA